MTTPRNHNEMAFKPVSEFGAVTLHDLDLAERHSALRVIDVVFRRPAVCCWGAALDCCLQHRRCCERLTSENHDDRCSWRHTLKIRCIVCVAAPFVASNLGISTKRPRHIGSLSKDL